MSITGTVISVERTFDQEPKEAAMTGQELLAELADCPPDAEVRLAVQPHYPFQHSIAGVCWPEEPDTCPDCGGAYVAGPGDDPCQCDERPTDAEIVYLAEGGQIAEAPYLPGYVAA